MWMHSLASQGQQRSAGRGMVCSGRQGLAADAPAQVLRSGAQRCQALGRKPF